MTFFDDYYRQALVSAPRGVGGAVAPDQIIAFTSAAATSIGFITALAWPILPATFQALLLGLTTGLFVWAAAGIVQLVNITVFHGLQRSNLLDAVEHARRQRQRQSA